MDQNNPPTPQQTGNNQNQNTAPAQGTSGGNPVPPQTPPAQTAPVQNPPAQQPKVKSSKNLLLIAAAILVLVLMGAGLYMVKSSGTANKTPGASDILSNVTPTVTPEAMMQKEQTQTDMSASDSSNTQIEKDMNNIDSTLNQTDSDLQNVDAGLSDTPNNLNE